MLDNWKYRQTTIQRILHEHFRLQKGTVTFKGIGNGSTTLTFIYQISKAVKVYLLQYRLEDEDLAAFAACHVTCLIIDGIKRRIPSLWNVNVSIMSIIVLLTVYDNKSVNAISQFHI